MDAIIFVVYLVASYWAVGETIYANKIRIGTLSDLLLTRVVLGFMLGFILIPVAIIKKLLTKQ